jgi:hypothetical protein
VGRRDSETAFERLTRVVLSKLVLLKTNLSTKALSPRALARFLVV